MSRNIQALLLTPYDASYAKVKIAIKEALVESGITPVSSDELFAEPGELIVNVISDAIRASDLIVADVSSLNFNVAYELGFAYALRKTTMLLVNVEAAKDISASLAGYFMLYYEPEKLDVLQARISRFVRSQTSRLSGVEASV